MSLEELPQADTIAKELQAVKRRKFILYSRDLINDDSFDIGRDIDQLSRLWFESCMDTPRLVSTLHAWSVRHIDCASLEAFIHNIEENPQAAVARLRDLLRQKKEGGEPSPL